MVKGNKKKLTKRQEAFVEAMADPNIKSQTEAARQAGYSPKSARLTATKNITNYNISAAIQNRRQRALAHYQVTPEEVLGSAVFNMRSSMDDLMDEDGFFDLNRARETGAVDLIKEIEFVETVDLETNEKKIRHKVKFESPAAARKEVANYIGLEKFGTQTPESLTDEQLAKELFRRLVENRGWAEQKALEGIKERFPNLDTECLQPQSK